MIVSRHPFFGVGVFGVASIVLGAMFVACDSSSEPSSNGTTDAAPLPTTDSGTSSSGGEAGPTDAADDVVVDAGKDAAVAVQADVTKDFATTANPNGAWTYGYTTGDPTGADAGALVVYSAVNNSNPNIPGWYDPANVSLGAPAAWRNDSGATSNGIASGEFAMHPGQAGEYAIARWTAPAAGSYAITVQFKTGDSGDTNGLLLHNGVALVTEVSTSTDAVHDLVVTLAAGDRLDAAVGSKGDFLYDSTPVRLTIRSAGSEP